VSTFFAEIGLPQVLQIEMRLAELGEWVSIEMLIVLPWKPCSK
jgi:hypothetical protein